MLCRCSANILKERIMCVCVCCGLRIQRDDSPQSYYISVAYDGTITSEDDIKIVSTCKMDVHKFPFDTQKCNITIGSASHCGEGGWVFWCVFSCFHSCLNSQTFLSFFLSFLKTVDEMRLSPFSNSSRATQFSREVMKTQGEWEFLQLSISKVNMTFENKLWENLIYTVRNTQKEKHKWQITLKNKKNKIRDVINIYISTSPVPKKSGRCVKWTQKTMKCLNWDIFLFH